MAEEGSTRDKQTVPQFVETVATHLSKREIAVEQLLGNIVRHSYSQQFVNTFSGEHHFPEKERFLFLTKHLTVIERAAPKVFDQKSDEVKNIQQLRKSMDRLVVECGTDIHLTPGMEQKELEQQLAELDKDKLKFAEILKTELSKNTGAFLAFLLEFARLVYRLNEYQAEARACARAALMDALGTTDHFQELLNRIRATPTGRQEPADDPAGNPESGDREAEKNCNDLLFVFWSFSAGS